MEKQKLEEMKSRLKQVFSDYYEEAGGWEYRYHHLLRARRYAVKLMETDEATEMEFDPEVVEIAALFHDIGRKEDIEDGHLNPMENHEGHAEAGAESVEDHISDLVSEERLERIRTVIRNHHSEPETAEGKIVQDADDLGKFSTIDLWRLVHYASDNERTLAETFEYFHNELDPESEELIDELHLEKSREVAEERLENYRKTMEQMEKEALGDDIL